MLPDNPNVSLKIVDCLLFTRRILVAEPNHQYLQCNLEREPAQYNDMGTIAKTFIFHLVKTNWSKKTFSIKPQSEE